MAAKRALLILAEGAEEMEAVISADVLRRGKVQTTVAGLTGADPVKCGRDVMIKPDTSLEDAMKEGPYDIVVLPGGLKGSENLAKSPLVKDVLTKHQNEGKFLAGICAGPTAFAAHGIGQGKKITSYPAVKDKFAGYEYLEERVVKDGNLITSRGPGTAMEFAVELVRALQGDDAASQLPEVMLMK